MSIATPQRSAPISTRIPVFVYALDPVSQAGVASQLRLKAEMNVLDESDIDRAAVAVVTVDRLDETVKPLIAALQRDGIPRVVIVAAEMDESSILSAVEWGASGFVRRSEASSERLADVVQRADRGDGTVPGDLLSSILRQAGQGPTVAEPELDQREIRVLTLVADGLDTVEIAREMCYSERTIKNVLHEVTSRLGLRNRSHAVAHAIRQGLI